MQVKDSCAKHAKREFQDGKVTDKMQSVEENLAVPRHLPTRGLCTAIPAEALRRNMVPRRLEIYFVCRSQTGSVYGPHPHPQTNKRTQCTVKQSSSLHPTPAAAHR